MTTPAGTYTAAQIDAIEGAAAAQAAAVERDKWQRHIDNLKWEHGEDLKRVHAQLATERRRNRIDAQTVQSALDNADLLDQVARLVADPRPGFLGRRAARIVAGLHDLTWGPSQPLTPSPDAATNDVPA